MVYCRCLGQDVIDCVELNCLLMKVKYIGVKPEFISFLLVSKASIASGTRIVDVECSSLTGGVSDRSMMESVRYMHASPK